MASQTNRVAVDLLTELPDSEFEERITAATERIEARSQRATLEGRDLSTRERELSSMDRDELRALHDASVIREHRTRMARAVDAAIVEHRSAETRSAAFGPNTLLVSDEHLEQHAAALRDGRPHGAVEARARVTVSGDLGSAASWDPGRPNEPRHLISFAGIRVSELVGRTATVPAYTGPVGGAGKDEATAHTEFDAIDPISLTGLRYGRWTLVSALANVVDDLRGINAMHAWGIARDLDLLAVNAIQTAASTPAVLGDDLDQQVRAAILQVAASTYSDESSLVIVGTPTDLSLLTGTAPANGDDKGSVSVRYAGARLYPTLAATADQVTVFAPSAFIAFQTRLQSATTIDPTDGSNKFGSWVHSTGVAQQIVGAAAAVATVDDD